jgi:hypothetical protein
MRKPFDAMVPAGGRPLDEKLGETLREWAAGGRAVGAAPVSAPSPSADLNASEPQRRLIFAKAREHGVDTDTLKAMLLEFTGQESSAGIPAGQVDVILEAIEAAGRVVA